MLYLKIKILLKGKVLVCLHSIGKNDKNILDSVG